MKTTIKTAVCPFCRNYNKVDSRTAMNINDIYRTDDIGKILQNTENRLICDKCNREFYYEHNCTIVNAAKDYVILSLPRHTDAPPLTKTALYKILGKENFRFRRVREFIHLTEIRIFEYSLDDRVIELIKYNCVPSAKEIGKDNKIILTDINGNAMTFTVYDGYDVPLSAHKVSTDAYHIYCKGLKDETIRNTNVQWTEINLRWAEKHTKENLRT